MGIIQIVIGIALAATVIALFLGLFSMARGGDFNARYGNILMRLRVITQGVAIATIGVAMLMLAFDHFGAG